MSNTWKIYMLTLISFLVGTSQFVISGILDEVATSVGVSLSAAGQLITVFALATAIGTPVVMVATANTLLGIFAVAKAIPSSKGEASVPLGKQLALLKNPKIATGLGVTFFVFIGYSVVNTYITPFLTSVMSFSGGVVSIILFILGIASLIGSKLGGFLADRTGTPRTLVISLFVQALSLALLSIASGSNFVAIPLLILWTIAAWTFGPTQNFILLSLAPEASGIMLSINSTFVQLGFAVGAGIGGVAVVGSSILSICWIGAAAVAAAVFVASVSFGLTRTIPKHAATE